MQVWDDAERGRQVESTATTWSNGAPAKLFNAHTVNTSPFRHYDVSPDGQRFLLIRTAGIDQGGGPPSVIVVQHFDEELKAKVPAK